MARRSIFDLGKGLLTAGGTTLAVENVTMERNESKTAIEEMQKMFDRGELRNLMIDTFSGEVIVRRHDGMNFAFPLLVAGDPAARDAILAKLANETPPRHVPDKPSTDMLRKMETPELVEGDGRQALAVQVEDLLGYTPLRKATNAPSRLQRLLQELEIEQFDLATVCEYKDRMKTHFQAKLDAKRGQAVRPGAVFVPEDVAFDWAPRLLGIADGWGMRDVRTVEWHAVDLSGYTKPVPEFVLRKCMQIKQRAPEAVFLVDELREERRTLDPFLVVKLGEEHAFIEVWDEPEFEKAL